MPRSDKADRVPYVGRFGIAVATGLCAGALALFLLPSLLAPPAFGWFFWIVGGIAVAVSVLTYSLYA